MLTGRNAIDLDGRHASDDAVGIPALVSRLVDDTRELAAAEMGLLKARVGERVVAFRGAAVFFVAAGVLALAGLVALLVGLILSLATLIGPGFATLAVTLVTFVIVGILAMIGKARLAPPTRGTAQP